MKIFAITDNYKDNPEEGERRQYSWRFLPDSSIFRAPNPFFLEEETEMAAAYPTLAIRIERIGKSVSSRFASRYSAHAAIAVNLRNLTLENRLHEQGLSIDPAWGYDRSLLLSDWFEIPLERTEDVEITIKTILSDDGISQRDGAAIVWKTRELNLGIPEVIEKVSRMNILKMGDVILPGFHMDGLTLLPGSRIRAAINQIPDLGLPTKGFEIPIK